MFWIEAVLGKAVAGRYRLRFFSAVVGVVVAVLLLSAIDYAKERSTPALTDINVLQALEGMTGSAEARALASHMSECLGQDFITQDCMEYATTQASEVDGLPPAGVREAMNEALSGLRR